MHAADVIVFRNHLVPLDANIFLSWNRENEIQSFYILRQLKDCMFWNKMNIVFNKWFEEDWRMYRLKQEWWIFWIRLKVVGTETRQMNRLFNKLIEKHERMDWKKEKWMYWLEYFQWTLKCHIWNISKIISLTWLHILWHSKCYIYKLILIWKCVALCLYNSQY